MTDDEITVTVSELDLEYVYAINSRGHSAKAHVHRMCRRLQHTTSKAKRKEIASLFDDMPVCKVCGAAYYARKRYRND